MIDCNSTKFFCFGRHLVGCRLALDLVHEEHHEFHTQSSIWPTRQMHSFARFVDLRSCSCFETWLPCFLLTGSFGCSGIAFEDRRRFPFWVGVMDQSTFRLSWWAWSTTTDASNQLACPGFGCCLLDFWFRYGCWCEPCLSWGFGGLHCIFGTKYCMTIYLD